MKVDLNRPIEPVETQSYNLTIRCDTEEEREMVLEHCDLLIKKGLIRYKCSDDSVGLKNNVYYSETYRKEKDWEDTTTQQRQVT